MKMNNKSKYLITNYHIISEYLETEYIETEIHNHKKMKLKLNNRDIKYFPKPKDITIIELKEYDDIYNDIEILDYDINYIKNGYNIYKDSYIFTIEYPYGEVATSASGKILNIINDYEFAHNIPTDSGSSGCPIILLNNNINLCLVIGIHKCADLKNNVNCGTFIGEIINNSFILNNNLSNDNYIIAEINIKDDDVNKNIRILNSIEEYKRSLSFEDKIIKKEEENEQEIKKCEIRINNELIPFNYFYKFKKKGKYLIKYSFKNYLTKTNYMFSDCSSLTEINLFNFITKNVTNMSGMFLGCFSLENINLFRFDTRNVNDMNYMFFRCSSLKNINLSFFDTRNVTNMSWMFSYCSSLNSIDLSNFITQIVTDMNSMFWHCSSLSKLDLSNFNTQNVTNMRDMFSGCDKLKRENLLERDNRISQSFIIKN